MIDENDLRFEKIDNNNYMVCVELKTAGELIKKADSWYFIYTGENGCESIEYYDSLKETKDELKQEFKNGLKAEDATNFGSYKY